MSNLGNEKFQDIPALGHDWGDWAAKTPATCLVKGVEERVCKRDASHKETREVAALGHDWGTWAAKTPATCLVKGVEEHVCKRDASHKETREVAALGHDWGTWAAKTPATCLAKGVEERVCKRDASHKETREVAALGHDWGDWAVKTPATCLVKGVEERVCKRDASHKETRDIPMLAHKEGKWEVVREATEEKAGLRVIKCLVGGEVLKQEEIRFNAARNFYSNTASTQGLYFRQEKAGMTKEWNMFTPLDISAEGEQTIPLIASNMYYIGTVKAVVKEGTLTISYEVKPGVKVRSEFLAIFNDLAGVASILPEKLADQAKAFGAPISIEKELGGDTKVLLYVRNVVDYSDKVAGIQRFTNRLTEYTAVLDGLRSIMD
ncbi:MAG: hypothetical protein AB9880_03815 [Christensenellales bacterium]